MKYIFLSPWKLNKSSPLFSYFYDFYQRLSKFVPCEIITSSSTLSEKETIIFYTKELKKISSGLKPVCFAFDENGEEFSSSQLAKELEKQEILAEKLIIFCFGSAYGLPKEIAQYTRIKPISLSKLTFAHELAYCIAFEQLYRAKSILANLPYHHGEKSPLMKEMKK
jgi:23S rRNA (pseudouridine1915-N3)-methyltransferase